MGKVDERRPLAGSDRIGTPRQVRFDEKTRCNVHSQWSATVKLLPSSLIFVKVSTSSAAARAAPCAAPVAGAHGHGGDGGGREGLLLASVRERDRAVLRRHGEGGRRGSAPAARPSRKGARRRGQRSLSMPMWRCLDLPGWRLQRAGRRRRGRGQHAAADGPRDPRLQRGRLLPGAVPVTRLAPIAARPRGAGAAAAAAVAGAVLRPPRAVALLRGLPALVPAGPLPQAAAVAPRAQFLLQAAVVAPVELAGHDAALLDVGGGLLPERSLLLGNLHGVQSGIPCVVVVERQAPVFGHVVERTRFFDAAGVVLRVGLPHGQVVGERLPQRAVHDEQPAHPPGLPVPVQAHALAVHLVDVVLPLDDAVLLQNLWVLLQELLHAAVDPGVVRLLLVRRVGRRHEVPARRARPGAVAVGRGRSSRRL
mmetsp:Transcript_78660/g.205118  ORF Transcript_78660/g.205118 Transcript_78660/m.205118 type:complete len:423 (+) Transcript_78660:16-1284(+)